MGNTCTRRAPEIKHLILSRNLTEATIPSDEEMQKLMTEIINEEFSRKKDPDSEFVKEISEFKRSKMGILMKNNENQEKNSENQEKNIENNEEKKQFVALMMRDIMSRVIETQKF